jgi:hypothetical protein
LRASFIPSIIPWFTGLSVTLLVVWLGLTLKFESGVPRAATAPAVAVDTLDNMRAALDIRAVTTWGLSWTALFTCQILATIAAVYVSIKASREGKAGHRKIVNIAFALIAGATFYLFWSEFSKDKAVGPDYSISWFFDPIVAHGKSILDFTRWTNALVAPPALTLILAFGVVYLPISCATTNLAECFREAAFRLRLLLYVSSTLLVVTIVEIHSLYSLPVNWTSDPNRQEGLRLIANSLGAGGGIACSLLLASIYLPIAMMIHLAKREHLAPIHWRPGDSGISTFRRTVPFFTTLISILSPALTGLITSTIAKA